jgi:hypothetical protein
MLWYLTCYVLASWLLNSGFSLFYNLKCSKGIVSCSGLQHSLNMPTSQQEVLRVRQLTGFRGHSPLATSDTQAGT